MNSFPHPRACGRLTPPASNGLWLALLVAWLLPIMSGRAVTLSENFTNNPLTHGWQVYGATNLFHWNATNQNLAVTWDNSQTNSYFYRPLGTILAKSDAFSLAFDLQLSVIDVDSPAVAVGLFNFSKATNTSFSRPAATTPSLFEFDYYADNGIGDPSIVATLTDTNVGPGKTKDFYFVYDNLPLDTGVMYHIVMNHAAGSTNLTGQVSANGQVYTSLPISYTGPITDFRIDTLSISSYGGGTAGTPVQGTVDNITITLPPPPIQNVSGALDNYVWQTTFTGQTNWLYTLQRTADFLSWSNAATTSISSGTNVVLTDTNYSAGRAFYRVRAERP